MEREESSFPARALSIFRLLLFLLGYPAGASAKERVAGLGATWRGLGTGKTAKHTNKFPNKLSDKSSSLTLSRQK